MRVVSSAFRNALEASRSTTVPVIFATITGDDLVTPIRVNSDSVDYIYQSNTYFGWSFNISLISDDENQQKGQISIQNVTSEIGVFVLDADDTVLNLDIKIFSKEDFSDANPRQAIGTPTVQYNAASLELRNITVDALQVTADITSFDLSSEPFPAIKATKDRLPALYR